MTDKIYSLLHGKTRLPLQSHLNYNSEQQITHYDALYKKFWHNRNVNKSRNYEKALSVYSNDIKTKYISDITGLHNSNVAFSMFKSQCYLNGITYGCERINRNGKNGLWLTKESMNKDVVCNIEFGLDIEAEDPRLFIFKGDVYIVFICISPYSDQNRGIGITKFEEWNPSFLRIRNMKNNYVEKNWSPFVKDDVLFFVYNYDPLVIITYDFNRDGICDVVFKQNEVELPIDTSKKYLRGGSNLIHYKDQYYVGACHSRAVDNVPIVYNTHIILLDTISWNIRYLSKPVAYICDDANCNLTKIPGTHILRYCSDIPISKCLFIINSPCSIYEKDGRFFITVNINDKITLLFELQNDISIDYNNSYSIGELENLTFNYTNDFISLNINSPPGDIKPVVDKKNTTIPKVIFQTWKTKYLSDNLKRIVDTWKNKNPDYDYILYDDLDCSDFIKNNYDDSIYQTYCEIIPKAFKADLWRYCVLYKYGGFYADVDTICFGKIDDFVTSNIDFIISTDLAHNEGQNYCLFNAFIGTIPNNPILLDCINQIVHNVKYSIIPKFNLDICGPGLIGRKVNLHLGVEEETSFKGKEGLVTTVDADSLNILLLRFDDPIKEYITDNNYNILFQNKNGNSVIQSIYKLECENNNINSNWGEIKPY
jgi:hypothetical protein